MDNKNKILTGVVIILSIAIIAMGWSLMNDEVGDECPKCSVCKNTTCPECSACPEPVTCQVCRNVTCPECPEPKECPDVKCPECEVCKQCPNVTCPECPKRSGGSCSCPACVCPEPEPCNVSNVSECRNDTVADFEIELYLNGTPINEVRNGSYYYQNETIEAKVKPNRVIYVRSEKALYWYLYKYADNGLVGVMDDSICVIPLCSKVCDPQYIILCPPPDPSCFIINCSKEEWAWNQTMYLQTTVTCPSNNETKGCFNASNTEIGKYVIKFCYKIDCPDGSYNAYGIEECIYKEFELL